jgi:two-component system, NarL family, sensor kinase
MASDEAGGPRDVDTLDGERQVLDMIATGASLAAVLDALCLVIDQRSGLMSAVFLIDSDGKRLVLAAGPHLPDEWRRATHSLPLTPTTTSCGAAVSRRAQVIVSDVSTDPLFEMFRDLARTAAIGAVWSTPFYAEDHRVLGTFAVISPAAGPPSELHLQLVKRATYLASIAVERQQTAEGLRRSERLLRLVLDALPVGVAVVDLAGNILLNNPASQRIWSRSIRSGPDRYAESKGWWHATGERIAPGEWPSARALVDGESRINEVIEIESFHGLRKIIQNSTVPIRDPNERVTGAVIVNEDVSDRMAAERELNDSYNQMRTLTGRLMRAQDDERRRIAEMLHETTAQDLAALKMLLARLHRTADRLSEKERSTLADCMSLAEQSMTQIRTLSYLLHPPFLDDTGLLPALRWYAGGFEERSGIKVDLELPERFERLPRDTETALFRVIQESLINIHRHAGSEIARIRLWRDRDALVLEIDDRGHGIPDSSLEQIVSGGGLVGVGIAGMRERIKQLDGSLEIASGAHGTTVRARLPLRKDAS